jgi:ribosomal protein S18 acetylase RimI-like enzyme
MTGSRFLIRRAQIGDAGALGEVQASSWREAYRDILPGDRLAASRPVEIGAHHAARLSNPEEPTVTFVAVVPVRGVVGFGVCGPARPGPEGHPGEIHSLYALSAVHGLGVGKALMAAMSGWLQAHALEPAFVGVLRDNTQARGFYEHLGGRYRGERPFRWQGLELIEALYGWDNLDRLLDLASADVQALFPKRG